MIFASIEVEALSVNVKSSASQTFIYSSSPHSPVLTTLHTTQVSPPHQHVLNTTASSGHQECKWSHSKNERTTHFCSFQTWLFLAPVARGGDEFIADMQQDCGSHGDLKVDLIIATAHWPACVGRGHCKHGISEIKRQNCDHREHARLLAGGSWRGLPLARRTASLLAQVWRGQRTQGVAPIAARADTDTRRAVGDKCSLNTIFWNVH